MEAGLYGSRPTSRSTGIVVGILALLGGLAVAELLVGLFPGSPSPVAAVGQSIIDLAPPWLKDWAIGTFGTSNKVVLVIGTLAVLAAIGGVVGVLALRGDLRTAVVLTGAVGLAGLLSVVSRPSAAVSDVVPTLGGVATVIVILWWFARRSPAPDATESPDSSSVMGPDRRQFLAGAGFVGAGAILIGGLGRMLQRRVEIDGERMGVVVDPPDVPAAPLPVDADLGIAGVAPFVTPTSEFFRIDTALTVPQLSRADWRLRVHGMVDEELELDIDSLLARPQVERYITLSCVSNDVGGSLVGNARWQGALLSDVLREAGIRPGADQIVSRSVDGWTCGTPTGVVMDGRDALLAVAMNGEPLPARHGYPVRMVVPGLFGYVSATKWVTEIELTTWDAFDAYWIPRGWAKEGPVKTMARIDRPRGSGRWTSGPLDIAGVAWAVHRGIAGVQVRIDEGPWLDAELGGVPSEDTWRQWRLRWDAPPGDHVLEVRAIDGDGAPQPDERRPPAPDGAQGYHRVRVSIPA